MTFKKIDKNQTIYHYFKLSTVLYALYDDLMDQPIMYGSLNKVEATVDSIRKTVPNVFFVYYDRDLQDKIPFKKNSLKIRVNNQKPNKATQPVDQIRTV